MSGAPPTTQLLIAGWHRWPTYGPWPDIIRHNIVGLADRADPLIEVGDGPVGDIASELITTSGMFWPVRVGPDPDPRGRLLLAFPGTGDHRTWDLIDRAVYSAKAVHAIPYQAALPANLAMMGRLPETVPVRSRNEMRRLRSMYDDRMPSTREGQG